MAIHKSRSEFPMANGAPSGSEAAPPDEVLSRTAVRISTLRAVPPIMTAWYLLYTKSQQEETARINLERQGYECYLPLMHVEKIRRRKIEIVTEPMFPRYLFIRLGSDDQGVSWSPIRSTVGVSQLVRFGNQAAEVDDELVELLHSKEHACSKKDLFTRGDSVVVAEGLFAGVEAIFQTTDSKYRSLI